MKYRAINASPHERKIRNIIIFGAGGSGHLTLQRLKVNPAIQILAFADNDKKKQGKRSASIPIISPEDIREQNPDQIIVASMHEAEIRKQLCDKLDFPLSIFGGTIELYAQECKRLCYARMLEEAKKQAGLAESLYGHAAAGVVRAELLLWQKEPRKATQELELAMNALGSAFGAEAYAKLARIYIHIQETEKAARTVHRGLQIHPEHWGLRIAEANVDMLSENWGNAIRRFHSLIDSPGFPSSPSLFERLIAAYRNANNLDAASDILRTALELFPDNPSLKVQDLEQNIAHHSYSTQRLAQQIDQFIGNTSGQLTDSLLLRLANAYKAVGQEQKAIQILAPITGRIELSPDLSGIQRDVARIQNVLCYSKSSATPYAATRFPAGYHSIEINGVTINGRRSPRQRLSGVPFDFNKKSVLDIGSNQGGMLLELSGVLNWGVGVDYDSQMTNAANLISAIKKANHLRFYTFNLETEDINRIFDFLPSPNVDIVFLLAMCRWIKNWRQVMHFALRLSPRLLFESNGTAKQQQEQIEELHSCYDLVRLVRNESADDPDRKDRQLYLCEKS